MKRMDHHFAELYNRGSYRPKDALRRVPNMDGVETQADLFPATVEALFLLTPNQVNVLLQFYGYNDIDTDAMGEQERRNLLMSINGCSLLSR